MEKIRNMCIYMMLHMAIIANSKPHKNDFHTWQSVFSVSGRCYLCTLSQEFPFLAHLPMCRLLQIQLCVFSICKGCKLYQLQSNKLRNFWDGHQHATYDTCNHNVNIELNPNHYTITDNISLLKKRVLYIYNFWSF